MEGPASTKNQWRKFTRVRKLHDSPVTREPGRSSIRVEIDGWEEERGELGPIPERCFQHQPAAKQDRLPARSSKHRQFSACSPTHILQNAAKLAAPLNSEISHARDAAGQNPYWCFSKTHAGPRAAHRCHCPRVLLGTCLLNQLTKATLMLDHKQHWGSFS